MVCMGECTPGAMIDRDCGVPTTKTCYVVGFLYDNAGEQVLLIRKTKPAWQKGRLNGIGGKVEPGESPLEAMGREFAEETGCVYTKWDAVVRLEHANWVVYFYRAFSTPTLTRVILRVFNDMTPTEETPTKCFVSKPRKDWLPNLRWLVPLCCARDGVVFPIQLQDEGKN